MRAFSGAPKASPDPKALGPPSAAATLALGLSAKYLHPLYLSGWREGIYPRHLLDRFSSVSEHGGSP